MRDRVGRGEAAFRLGPTESDRLRTERGEAATGAMHYDNLFDEDEDAAGERVHLDTGKRIDNSTATSKEIDGIVARRADQAPIGEVIEAEDAAEKWLRENDPDHPGYTGPAKKEDEAM